LPGERWNRFLMHRISGSGHWKDARMRIDVITIFPEYLEPLRVSLLGKAAERGLHRTVDDTPYGGGPGMVMKAEPWALALASVAGPADAAAPPTLVVPTPSGRPFTQAKAAELAAREHLVFACGRYEGIDRRVIDAAAERMPVEELSIGDYVLAGGEAAVLVIVEAVARLLPGVLGNVESARDDSFAEGAMSGLLEGPVYTKPADWRGRAVPEVLTSGNHGAIARWRRDQALARTAAHRPDLLAALDRRILDKKDRAMLEALGWAQETD
jgi:tRNA (guanine37-N1)-methyltransferase